VKHAPSPTDFGAALRQARIRAGLTQPQLAAMLGCTVPELSLYENGKRTPLTPRYLEIIEWLRGTTGAGPSGC
jgi:transcriptional regulator with XRE-family HTH domain